MKCWWDCCDIEDIFALLMLYNCKQRILYVCNETGSDERPDVQTRNAENLKMNLSEVF